MDKSYSKKQLLRIVALAVIATAAVGLVFVETAYPTVRASVRDLVKGPPPPPPPPARVMNRAGGLDFPRGQEFARERTQEILQLRETELGLEDQHRLMTIWHDLRIWQSLWYLGIRIQKNPMDLWMMQQIITEVKPDYIIETGTLYGGSALYWAHILDGLGLEESRVITIDITDRTYEVSRNPLWDQYVEFIHSSSTDPETVENIRERVEGKTVLVTLDSAHEADHVLAELRAYGPMVSPGSYIVAEDTNMDGIPVWPQIGAGPMTAVIEYMDGEGGELFEQDLSRENFILTFNPGGWLKRKAE